MQAAHASTYANILTNFDLTIFLSRIYIEYRILLGSMCILVKRKIFLSAIGHVSEVGDGVLLKSGRVVQGRVMSGNYYDNFQT